jgi:hypothetical protein
LEELVWALRFSVSTTYAAGGPGPVLEASQRCLEIAERLDSEDSRVHAYMALARRI